MMETVYYTLTARGIVAEGELEQAAGGVRRVMLVPSCRAEGSRTGGDNVVDLAAWKARREEEARLEAEVADWASGDEESWDEAEAAATEACGVRSRRERRNHAVLFTGEFLATLSVIAVAAALLFRILAV